VKRHLVYFAQLLVVALSGYLLVLPWAMAWVVLNDRFIAPIFARWTHCCGMPSGDPIDAMSRIYSVFDSIVVGLFALASSLILGRFLRVHWAISWAVFCGFAYLGVRDFAHSRFGITALFMMINPTMLVFAFAAMAGFWCGSALRQRRARLTIVGGVREAR
jgi:hypothetical protein